MGTGSAVSPAARPRGRARAPLERAALLYVAGKGGAGKSTVAAALGLLAAGEGRRTVVCELGGAAQLPRWFGVDAVAGEPAALTEGLWSLTVDPQRALREWLRRQPGGELADAVLGRSAGFAHFVAAAPGARELVTLGKLADLAGVGPGSAEAAFDLVIVDAAATGHAIGMLQAPGAVGQATLAGPVASQARVLQRRLRDPGTTAFVGVALPEEMAVEEVLALDRGIAETLGRGLDLIVVDAVYPDRFSDAEARAVGRAGRRAGCDALTGAVVRQHRRARLHAAQVRRLRARAGAPVVTLPFVFEADLGEHELRQLARVLGRRLRGG
jgi:hypothetical protein